MISIDTGDTVFHRPSREAWLVAYVTGTVERPLLCASGWPESLVPLSDCLLVDKATPAERDAMLRRMSEGPVSDTRVSYARRRLSQGAQR